MPRGDDVGRLADEVLFEIQHGADFHKAFAACAHRCRIYHRKDRGRYNYFFRKVRERLNKRDPQLLKESLIGPRPWQHGKMIRAPAPLCREELEELEEQASWEQPELWEHSEEDILWPDRDLVETD